MSDYANITATPLLLSELRKGLWHCTSPSEFRQILRDRSIKPNDGRVSRWGPRKYACQELGGVSLLDLQSPTLDQVIQTADRWGPFVCSGNYQTTVLLGLDRAALAANLVPYPANKGNTTGAVIPFVETCHRGPIPTAAITYCLLVCSTNCSHFYLETALADPRLAEVEAEFLKVTPAGAEERAKLMKAVEEKVNSPEFKAQMQRARQAAERAKRNR
ncbi:MAG TPA: hypothetical protein VMU04_24100 [Candidatus Acidoferrum sp.]|nr:hypothetical protein [Candidatus Acidoferrum sp.]